MDKRCTGPCGMIKPVAAFSKRAKAKDGRQAWCKQCMKDRRKEIRKPADPKKQRVFMLMHLYGLTVEQWDQMLIEQAGRCAICNEPMKSPHVDHSHTTGAVRGLLCLRCNTMLGHFERFGAEVLEGYRMSEWIFPLEPMKGKTWEALYWRFLASSYN
jgi:Recombination endonuclease VII